MELALYIKVLYRILLYCIASSKPTGFFSFSFQTMLIKDELTKDINFGKETFLSNRIQNFNAF